MFSYNLQHFVPRPEYDTRLNASVGTPNIKILTGIRRCGKSTLLAMLANRMKDAGFPEENIFFKRFDQFGMPLSPSAEWLLQELHRAKQAASPTYPFRVFLDEIQEVEKWDKVLRQLHTAPDIDVFITGSNAQVLSSDLSTFLAGRYEIIEVFSLSFAEYKSFNQAFWQNARSYNETSASNNTELFQRYLTYGGMPGLFALNQENTDAIASEISTLFDAVILNDVAARAEIRNIDLLLKLIRYVFSTSGSLFSTKKLSDSLTSMGRKVKPETVDNYLVALQRGFALYACEQEGIVGKDLLRPLRKYYPADTGFRNLATGFSGADVGFQLENAVYLELRRRGFDVTVGATQDGEVDFVAKRFGRLEYIQVCNSLLEEKVYAREVKPLREVADSFPKTILTLDGWRAGVTEDGIQILSLIDWLLGEG